MKTYKGFDKELKCQNFQYEIGKEFEEKKKIELCKTGFHSCKNPLHVLRYYPPISRFCETEIDGDIIKCSEDSKIVSSKIKISAEITLKTLLESGFKFVFEKIKWGEKDTPQTHGDSSAAQTHGHSSAAQTHGKESIAVSTGINGKASGIVGNWLVLTEWYENEWKIKKVHSVKVDGKKIKADTWYTVKEGKIIVCSAS